MTAEFDVEVPAGKLHAYDTGPTGRDDELVVVWHHGTPNLGSPPAPLFPLSERLGLRWVGYDRPGYGGSAARPDRDVASAAADVGHVADALGIERFAVLSHSGGGPHALACAVLLPGRVRAAVTISSMAPFGADGLDWYAGMAPSAAASLREAAAGRTAKEAWESQEHEGELGEPGFTAGDWEALRGDWSWIMSVVNPALAGGPAPLIDDDLAYVRPWGFDPAEVTVPALVLHGADDVLIPASHAAWLAARIPGAELRVVPGEGHVSVLRHAPSALEWLRAKA